MSDWAGESPYYLVFEPRDNSGNIGIDVDATGWIESNRATFHASGTWLLVSKDGIPMLCLPVLDGEQMFFLKHHVGLLGTQGAEVTVVILGKKHVDGSTTRLCLMPNGMVMVGDEAEVDHMAARMLG